MIKNKRLVFLAISSELGGAERSLVDLVSTAQTESPFAPIVILPKSGPLEDLLKNEGIATLIEPLPSLYESISRKNTLSFVIFALLGLPQYLLYARRLKGKLDRLQPVAVHSTGIKNHVLCCLLSLVTPYSYVVHFRDFMTAPALRFFYSCFRNKKNVRWMAASKALTMGLSWTIPVFYDGLDDKRFFKNPTAKLKTDLGLSPSTRLIGHAAALTPWKGQSLFLEAASELLKTHKDLHFVIIGSPIYTTNSFKNYDQDLKALTKKRKLEERVHFVPFIKNSREIYDSLDVFVHSSLQPEPFGRVILEALFCEKPVVAARAGGVLEIMNSNAAEPLLHTPGDLKSLTQTIENALALKDNQLQILVQDAKARFQKNYCYKRQVDYLINPH